MRNWTKLDVVNASCSQRERILHYAADVRKFEIERFWQRSLFFWGFIGAAFVAYAGLYPKKEERLPLLIACFGVVCSLAWTLQNRGSKYWQEAWEQKVETIEECVLGTRLFSNKEPVKEVGHWRAAAFSVSRLAIALSDFTALIWACMLIAAFPCSALPIWLTQGSTILVPASLISIIAWSSCVVTAFYVVLLFKWGRSQG